MLIWIAFGGAAGSVLRYVLGGAVQRGAALSFPAGTLAVNVAGCFVIGILTQHFMNMQSAPPAVRAALVTGFCGGFTTFSAFSIETVALIQGGEYAKAATYVAMSIALSVGATMSGIAAARAAA
jgi:CrcB protein